jgi:hypothetical protein
LYKVIWKHCLILILDVNECLRNPCQNGGSCRNTNGGYTCTCTSAFQGKNCEQGEDILMKNRYKQSRITDKGVLASN